ncbi:MAG: DUF6446 family protein [Marinibacterium sp.]|nr:DUF6446 family protein [Marinibacterium sp.]
MSGKLVGSIIIALALIAGAALYYLQIYAFYSPVPDNGHAVVLASDTGPVPVPYTGFQAIDAESSPIRYRACFDTGFDPATTPGLIEMPGLDPRNAPGWFDCFDAKTIADDIAAGTARVYLSAKNIAYGVDRVVALTDDGRGYAWHELNDCGEKSYDGTVVGETCPDRPDPAK